MSVTLKLPKSNAVILYVMGGLMVVFGLFLALALLGNESVAGAVTIFLFFVFWTVVLIWLGKISSGVTYTADEWGVHWYRPFGKKACRYCLRGDYEIGTEQNPVSCFHRGSQEENIHSTA